MPLSQVEAEALLNKHNPLLVILSRPDRNHPDLARPYEAAHGRNRGDYHPHKVDLFLRFVERYETVRPFKISNVLQPATWPWPRIQKWPKFPWNWFTQPLPPPIPPDEQASSTELRELVAATPIGASAPWELDMAPIRSQDPDQAWQVYRGLLQSLTEEETAPVVYGRCTETADKVLLQYWYFYLYNDSGNKHEGDWEMVTLVLDDHRNPERVAYAGHTGGAQRDWKAMRDPNGAPIGERPYIYVALGSHAAYLDHMPRGHKSVSVEYQKNLAAMGPLMNVTVQLLSRVLFFVGVKDVTPTLSSDGTGSPQGEVVEPDSGCPPREERPAGRAGFGDQGGRRQRPPL